LTLGIPEVSVEGRGYAMGATGPRAFSSIAGEVLQPFAAGLGLTPVSDDVVSRDCNGTHRVSMRL